MAIYNTTNLTASNTVYDVALAVNDVSQGNIGMIMVSGFTLLLFYTMSLRFSFSSSFTASTFAGLFMSIILSTVGLFASEYVIVMTVIFGLSLGFLYFESRRP